jgi:hypothetical protein
MSEQLHCYRCGTSLESLPLPLGRLDECPECHAELHACRMCRNYDPAVPRACTEDDAIDVRDKERANFCDYFKPSPDAGNSEEWQAEQAAREKLKALFGEAGGAEPTASDAASAADAEALRKAEALFRK